MAAAAAGQRALIILRASFFSKLISSKIVLDSFALIFL